VPMIKAGSSTLRRAEAEWFTVFDPSCKRRLERKPWIYSLQAVV